MPGNYIVEDYNFEWQYKRSFVKLRFITSWKIMRKGISQFCRLY